MSLMMLPAFVLALPQPKWSGSISAKSLSPSWAGAIRAQSDVLGLRVAAVDVGLMVLAIVVFEGFGGDVRAQRALGEV